MERWVGRVALVTGASEGIGAAVCEVLVKHGMKVVGCARSVEKIQARAQKLSGLKGTLYPEKCDLTKESEILEMFRRIKAQHGGVDVCINNAGVGYKSRLLDGETHHWVDMLQLNILALSICTREAYKSMKERNVTDGHFIHINSFAAHQFPRTPNINFYSATKQCVRALMLGLRNEIRATKTDIRVSEVSPGLVETDFLRRYGGEKKAKEIYARNPTIKASDVADSVLHMLSAPPGVEVNDILILATRSLL